jgi:hypothetical protein
MTTTTTSQPHEGVPLPTLSDDAAVEIYLFIEHLFLLFESRFGDQIRRHFDGLDQDHLIGPDFDRPLDDPPF